MQAAGELPDPPRPEDLIGLQLEEECLEVVEPVEGGHRARERPGGRPVDPSHARPERALAQALEKAELEQDAVDPTSREDEGDVSRDWLGHVTIVVTVDPEPRRGAAVFSDRGSRVRRDAVGRGRQRRPQRVVLRAHRSLPVPCAGVPVRRGLHDRRAPRPRVGGARRPESPLARATCEGGEPQPEDRRPTRAHSARALRTTRGRLPAARFTVSRARRRGSRIPSPRCRP